MKKKLLLFIVLVLSSSIFAYEIGSLVNIPTAGILQQGEAAVNTKIYKENGMLIGADVGIFPRFMFGIRFGGENIVGNEQPNWHPRVEVNAKFRIIDEGPKSPAVVLGFNSQGHGVYHEGAERYDIKSRGFYAVGSRNYLFMGNLGFHFGMNYSLEHKDNDKDFNFFFGMDKSIGKVVNLLVEYEAPFNDNEAGEDENTLDVAGRGYLNLGTDILLNENLVLKISALDLLENGKNTTGMDRAISLIYRMSF